MRLYEPQCLVVGQFEISRSSPALEPFRNRGIVPGMARRPTDEEMKAKALDRWTNEGGARAPSKNPKRPRDTNQLAHRIVDIATGDGQAEILEDRERGPRKLSASPHGPSKPASATEPSLGSGVVLYMESDLHSL